MRFEAINQSDGAFWSTRVDWWSGKMIAPIMNEVAQEYRSCTVANEHDHNETRSPSMAFAYSALCFKWRSGCDKVGARPRSAERVYGR